MDCRGQVPAIGDADDGEVWCLAHDSDFDSYRSLVAIGAALFRRTDLSAKARSSGVGNDGQLPWLGLGAPPLYGKGTANDLPRSFPQGGYIVVGEALDTPREFRVTFDCGALGYNRIAGHGHADALAVLVSWEGDPLLVDAGTYCYNAAPEWRRFFRSTSAHNSLLVDGFDQSEYGASFLWLRDVNAVLHEERRDDRMHVVHASHDGYLRLRDPVRHHRRVTLEADSGRLVVEDWLECRQPHDVTMHWHAAAAARLWPCETGWQLATTGHSLSLSVQGALAHHEIGVGCESPVQGWVSRRFYQREAAPVLVTRARLASSQILRTVVERVARHSAGREPGSR